MYLDAQGNILGPTDDPHKTTPASIWEELVDARNIRHYFDLPRGLRLDALPVWDPDGPDRTAPHFYNKRAFIRLEDPGRFFTRLPTAVLSVLRPDEKTFIGIIRQTGAVPNISIGGTGCIVYTDGRDRLAGFNENFLEILDARPAEPLSLLGKPVERFFSPSPSQLHQKQAALHPMRPRPHFRERFGADFSAPGLNEIHCTDPQSLSHTAGGLLCRNLTDDFIYLTLPAYLDTHLDFLFTADVKMAEGPKPVFFLTRQPDPALYPKQTPDIEGYQAGAQPTISRFGVKRKAILQKAGRPVRAEGEAVLELFKIGNTLRLLEDRDLKIEYCDFDFLHHAKVRAVLGVRAGSACLIRKVSLATAEPENAGQTDVTPIVRFNTAAAHAAILTRINNVHLVASFPDVSAWVLENITQLEAQITHLRRENQRLLQAVGVETGEVIGKSAVMQGIRENAAKVADTGATVLLQGGTGTGKEVLARFLHRRSARRDMPFVKVDCAVISPALMESELFGHEKGAFTGAHVRHIGRFERAQGGTVFLDEAGNLPPEAQAKLLHFLQDRVITRVGGREAVRLDVRVIVASNTPLSELVRQGRFREDLFFRIDVVSFTLPVLSERIDDLPELCAHFLDEFSRTHKKNVKGLTSAAHRKIAAYGWPGNIRELRNTLERAVLFCAGDTIDDEDIVFSLEPGARKTGRRGPYRHGAVDMGRVREALGQKKGNLKEAAKALGIPRRTLYYQIKKKGLTTDALRTGAG